jgi:hypothetical protein
LDVRILFARPTHILSSTAGDALSKANLYSPFLKEERRGLILSKEEQFYFFGQELFWKDVCNEIIVYDATPGLNEAKEVNSMLSLSIGQDMPL